MARSNHLLAAVLGAAFVLHSHPGHAAEVRNAVEAGESAGDLACETGIVRLVATDGTLSQARYVVVWKREGGQWKLHRDIWNSEN